MEEKKKADRFNIGKTRYDLLPEFAVNQIAKVLTHGAEKYGDNNWRKGLPFSNCLASMKRHIAKMEAGQDYDEETGELHMAHAATNAMFILEYYKIAPEMDDRNIPALNIPRIGLDVDDVIADFCGAYTEKYNIEPPLFWHFSYNIFRMTPEEHLDFMMNLKPKFDPATLLFEPVCYITSRGIDNKHTMGWIEKNGFPCVPVYTVDVNHSKVEIAKQAGIDVFIDDKFENFVELNKAGINCYLLTAPHNAKYDVGHKRLNSVNEILTRYNKI